MASGMQSVMSTLRMVRALPANQRRPGRNRAMARSNSGRARPVTSASIEPLPSITGVPRSAISDGSSRAPSMASQ